MPANGRRDLIRRLKFNKIQHDSTVCRYLFTASLLYMFRASIAPIIRSTKNCSCSLWYRSYYVTVQQPSSNVAYKCFGTRSIKSFLLLHTSNSPPYMFRPPQKGLDLPRTEALTIQPIDDAHQEANQDTVTYQTTAGI